MKVQKSVMVLGAALFLSLSLNLFFGGMILGRGHHAPRHAWAEREKALKEQLSPADRAVLKEAMNKNRARLSALKKELDEARDQVQEALQAGDQSAIDEALRAEKAKQAEILRLMRESRAEAARRLSPQGRALLQKIGAAAQERTRAWRSRAVDRAMEKTMGPEADFLFDLGGPDDPDFKE